MASPRIRKIVINTTEPERAAEFWSGVLDVAVQDHGPEASIVWLAAADATAVTMGFQRVANAEGGSNTHLDIAVDDLDAVQTRIESLGGSIVKINKLASGFEWRIATDPQNNQFCIFPESY